MEEIQDNNNNLYQQESLQYSSVQNEQKLEIKASQYRQNDERKDNNEIYNENVKEENNNAEDNQGLLNDSQVNLKKRSPQIKQKEEIKKQNSERRQSKHNESLEESKNKHQSQEEIKEMDGIDEEVKTEEVKRQDLHDEQFKKLQQNKKSSNDQEREPLQANFVNPYTKKRENTIDNKITETQFNKFSEFILAEKQRKFVRLPRIYGKRTSVTFKCPYCKNDKEYKTKLKYECTGNQWCTCLILCFLGGYPVCCFPFLIKKCYNVKHLCPNCMQQIGESGI